VHCDIDVATWLVFQVAEDSLEGPAEEEVGRGVLDDMGMEREGDVADSHSEMFCTAESTIDCAVGSFHLEAHAGA